MGRKSTKNADGLAESGVFDEIVKSAYKNRRNKINKEVRRRVLRNIWHEDMTLNQFWDEIISQEQEIIHDTIFKMYCPLVAKGVDKEMLKEIAYELMESYGIERNQKEQIEEKE